MYKSKKQLIFSIFTFKQFAVITSAIIFLKKNILHVKMQMKQFVDIT